MPCAGWREDLSGAWKVEKGSDVNPRLLSWEGTPLPWGSVSGYRCHQLGPGIYAFIVFLPRA